MTHVRDVGLQLNTIFVGKVYYLLIDTGLISKYETPSATGRRCADV